MFGQPEGRKIPQNPRARNKLIYGIVVALLVAVALISGRQRTKQIRSVVRSEAPFQIHVIDVGQGDSILVLADGHAMLIDSGDVNGGKAVADYLDTLGITELDYAVTTHLHFDHIGGFAAASRGRQIGCVIEPVCSEALLPDDTAYQIYRQALSGDAAPECQQMQCGDSFTLGKAQVQVIAPMTCDVSNLNDTSLVLRVQYEDTVCLFTGDMTAEEETDVVASDYDLNADFLKVAHHGSSYGTGDAFLQMVTPEFAAVSCGKNNDYGHPAPETLDRLKKAGAQVNITAEQGNLVYLYENGKLHCVPQKTEET